jgi:hypothetical protein
VTVAAAVGRGTAPRLLAAALLVAGLPLALCAGHAAAAETVTLTAVADATLIEDASGGLANGSGVNNFVGRTGANAGESLRRLLVRFDFSALPPGAVVETAVLRLSLTRSRFAGDLPISVHRVTASWNEGPTASAQGNGDLSQTGDVTWIHRNFPALLWSATGGDYVAAASTTRAVGSTGGPYDWPPTATMVADVQGWIANPAGNFGWLLIGFEGGGTSAKGFAAREIATDVDRPKLVLSYSVAPVADQDIPLPAWAIGALALALVGAQATRRRTAQR